MSTTITPLASSMDSPAPSAAAMLARISAAFFAPLARTALWAAACSTRVAPVAMDTTSRFFSSARRLPSAFSASDFISSVACSTSATAPSITGDSSATSLGVRPSIWRASRPTPSTSSASSRRVST